MRLTEGEFAILSALAPLMAAVSVIPGLPANIAKPLRDSAQRVIEVVQTYKPAGTADDEDAA